MKKSPPHLNIVLTLTCENETSAASSMVWNIKFIKYRGNKLISQSMFKMPCCPSAAILLWYCGTSRT